MIYKNKKTGAVISIDDFRKLSIVKRQDYYSIDNTPPTHRVSDDEDDSGDILTALIIGEAIETAFDSSGDSGSSDSPSDFSSFDGGESGGGGAGSDF